MAATRTLETKRVHTSFRIKVLIDMLMFMPSKNVYVAEQDLKLFEEATAFAGSLSAAVAAGLRLYVARNTGKGTRMDTVELDVDEGSIVKTKRFQGQLLIRWRQEVGTRTRSFRVFKTANGQFAVYERNDPNWALFSSPDEDDPVWERPEVVSGSWWRSEARRLTVFPDIGAMAAALPDDLIEAVRHTVDGTPATEELDI